MRAEPSPEGAARIDPRSIRAGATHFLGGVSYAPRRVRLIYDAEHLAGKP